MAVKKQQQESFEELMIKLEQCAASLDKGGLPLSESLELYEQGMSMAAEASKRLRTAELRIEKIKTSYQQAVPDEVEADLS